MIGADRLPGSMPITVQQQFSPIWRPQQAKACGKAVREIARNYNVHNNTITGLT